jgi:hypothetical protein
VTVWVCALFLAGFAYSYTGSYHAVVRALLKQYVTLAFQTLAVVHAALHACTVPSLGIF